MKRSRIAFFTLASLALAAPLLAEGKKRNDLEAKVLRVAQHATPRTAIVYGAIGLGSGAVVDRAGTTVTNAHVGLGARIALLEFSDGRQVSARCRGIDLERDLAIYEPEEPLERPAPCFEIKKGRPEVGQWLVAIGFPGGPRGDLQPTVSLGQAIAGGGLSSPVQFVLRYDDAIRTDIGIFSGNSGGPLVDLEGRLVGINGAIEPSSAAAFAIPMDVVEDRLETLRGGVIVLPGGRRLEPSNPAVAALEKAFEGLSRQLTKRVKEGFSPTPGGEVPNGLPARGLDDPFTPILRKSARSTALLAAVREATRASRGAAVSLSRPAEALPATRLDRTHFVVKSSLLYRAAAAPQFEGSPVWRVATDEANDLALMAVEMNQETKLSDPKVPEDAPLRPAGSFVAVLGPDGPTSAGIVTVGARRIPAAVSMRISGGGESPVLPIVRQLEKLAKTVKIEGLEQLLEGVRKGLEMQGALNVGNDPRGYARVLSTDVPLAPADAGYPLVDADGRLVGVTVANAHYGTAYAVPIATVRKLFEKQLGPAAPPARLGKSRLY